MGSRDDIPLTFVETDSACDRFSRILVSASEVQHFAEGEKDMGAVVKSVSLIR